MLRKKQSVSLRLVLAALMAALGTVAAAQERPTTLTICDIRNHPEKYLGKRVIVTGEAHREYHGTSLSSPKCDLGAVLVESTSLGQSQAPTVTLYRKGLGKTLDCRDDRPFVVTVRGRFNSVKIRGMKLYRITIDEVEQAEFGDGLSEPCAKHEVPPPNITLPPSQSPTLF